MSRTDAIIKIMTKDTPMRQTPPYNEEAEKSLIGALLLDCPRVTKAIEPYDIIEESLYVPAHRLIFKHVAELVSTGKAVDVITVSDSLKQTSELQMVGGDVYLDACIEDTPTTAHSEHYAEIVKRDHGLRKIIQEAEGIREKAYAQHADPESITSEAQYDFAIMNKSNDTASLSAMEIIDNQIETWEMAKTIGCAGIPTGMSLFDKYFGGLMEGVYFISGYGGSGKTTLGRNVCENVAHKGIPVHIWTMEQTEGQIWGSIAGREAGVSVFQLNSGRCEGGIERIKSVREYVASLPIVVDDSNQTLASLWNSVRTSIAENGTRLFMLDYIQAITPAKNYGNEESKIADFSNGIRAMAKEFKIPIICISALSREGKLRGSGMLDYDAWAHIKLKQSETFKEDGLVNVSFEKQRFGPLAYDTQLKLIGGEQRFVDPVYLEE